MLIPEAFQIPPKRRILFPLQLGRCDDPPVPTGPTCRIRVRAHSLVRQDASLCAEDIQHSGLFMNYLVERFDEMSAVLIVQQVLIKDL